MFFIKIEVPLLQDLLLASESPLFVFDPFSLGHSEFACHLLHRGDAHDSKFTTLLGRSMTLGIIKFVATSGTLLIPRNDLGGGGSTGRQHSCRQHHKEQIFHGYNRGIATLIKTQNNQKSKFTLSLLLGYIIFMLNTQRFVQPTNCPQAPS